MNFTVPVWLEDTTLLDWWPVAVLALMGIGLLWGLHRLRH